MHPRKQAWSTCEWWFSKFEVPFWIKHSVDGVITLSIIPGSSTYGQFLPKLMSFCNFGAKENIQRGRPYCMTGCFIINMNHFPIQDWQNHPSVIWKNHRVYPWKAPEFQDESFAPSFFGFFLHKAMKSGSRNLHRMPCGLYHYRSFFHCSSFLSESILGFLTRPACFFGVVKK